MKTSLVMLVPVCMLAACANPLDSLEKLSEIELAGTDPVRGALASPEEINRDEPVLTSLINAAVDDTAKDTTEAVAPEPKRKGLFARLRDAALQPDDTAVAALDPLKISPEPASLTDPLSEVDVPQDKAASEPHLVVAQDADNAGTSVLAAKNESPSRQQGAGLLGLAKKPDVDEVEVQKPVQLASLDANVGAVSGQNGSQANAAQATPDRPKKRKGLFANNAARPQKERVRNGPDAQDVDAGTALPYGVVARVCDVKSGALGQKIEQAGAGKGYVLYDSVPGSTSPRTFYVTGFADGCARQFTAALALFGAPSMHEQLRYGRPAAQYPYSTTDQAYELVKSSICGVGKRKPCGSKISRLEKDTIFISTYERFTDNGRWADILLHDGRVLAKAIKDL